jgi:hypothetical protein
LEHNETFMQNKPDLFIIDWHCWQGMMLAEKLKTPFIISLAETTYGSPILNALYFGLPFPHASNAVEQFVNKIYMQVFEVADFLFTQLFINPLRVSHGLPEMDKFFHYIQSIYTFSERTFANVSFSTTLTQYHLTEPFLNAVRRINMPMRMYKFIGASKTIVHVHFEDYQDMPLDTLRNIAKGLSNESVLWPLTEFEAIKLGISEHPKMHRQDFVTVLEAMELPRLKLLITNCNDEDIYQVLASGKPILCIPLTQDQMDNAQKVVKSRIGLSLPLNSTWDKVRDATQQILANSKFADFAQYLKQSYQSSPASSEVIKAIRNMKNPPAVPPHDEFSWIKVLLFLSPFVVLPFLVTFLFFCLCRKPEKLVNAKTSSSHSKKPPKSKQDQANEPPSKPSKSDTKPSKPGKQESKQPSKSESPKPGPQSKSLSQPNTESSSRPGPKSKKK